MRAFLNESVWVLCGCEGLGVSVCLCRIMFWGRLQHHAGGTIKYQWKIIRHRGIVLFTQESGANKVQHPTSSQS